MAHNIQEVTCKPTHANLHVKRHYLHQVEKQFNPLLRLGQ